MQLGKNHNPSYILGYLLEIIMKIKQIGIFFKIFKIWVLFFHEKFFIYVKIKFFKSKFVKISPPTKKH